MIISVNEFKKYTNTDVPDIVLEGRLQALETSIRNKTHNNFQDRRVRTSGDVVNGQICLNDASMFKVGDTIMVNDDLAVITNITFDVLTVDEEILDAENVLVTKVKYPKDIILGVIDVMIWMLDNPSSKAGISSETLSRHSVTYQGNTEFDADIGCPVRLLSFLNQYKKARF